MTSAIDIANATVVYRHDLTPELAIVRLQPDGGEVPAFEPGQFCVVGLPMEAPPATPGKSDRPRLVRRAYSIASSPLTRDYVELFVVLVQGGRLTPRLWTVEEGGRVFMDAKITGRFTLAAVPPTHDLVLVSTGTGIAPYMSMLRTYWAPGRPSTRWRRLVIVHGVRRSEDLGYREELEAAAQADRSITYIPVVSREPAESLYQGLRGRVQAALEESTYQCLVGAPLDPAQAHVYLCGNPAMIVEVEALLEARGFVTAGKVQPGAAGNIHFERYW